MKKKISLIILGSALLALGAYMAQVSQLGSDPLSYLWVGMAIRFNITMGQANLISAFIMLVIAYFYDKSFLHVGTILSPLVITVVFDLMGLTHFAPKTTTSRIVVFLSGMVIYAYGLALYLKQDFGKSPYDGLITSGMGMFKKSYGTIKTCLDAGLYMTSILLGAPIVIGPFIFALFSGMLIQWFLSSKLVV